MYLHNSHLPNLHISYCWSSFLLLATSRPESCDRNWYQEKVITPQMFPTPEMFPTPGTSITKFWQQSVLYFQTWKLLTWWHINLVLMCSLSTPLGALMDKVRRLLVCKSFTGVTFGFTLGMKQSKDNLPFPTTILPLVQFYVREATLRKVNPSIGL